MIPHLLCMLLPRPFDIQSSKNRASDVASTRSHTRLWVVLHDRQQNYIATSRATLGKPQENPDWRLSYLELKKLLLRGPVRLSHSRYTENVCYLRGTFNLLYNSNTAWFKCLEQWGSLQDNVYNSTCITSRLKTG